MRIGVDASCWGNKRGFGRFTRELMTSLLEVDQRNEYVFFIDSKTADSFPLPEGALVDVVQTSASQVEAASADGRRSMSDVLAMSRKVFGHKLDLFFFPAVYSYFPIFNKTKVIVTVHDVIADRNPQLIFPNKRSMYFWKLKQNLAIRQADIVLTVSDYSKGRIEEYFGLSESRMRVVNEGTREEFRVFPNNGKMGGVLSRFGLEPGSRFLLYVGGISPHKNLNSLAEAFEKISARPDCEDVRLVLVGDYKDDPFFSAYPSLKKQFEEAGIDDKVIFTGFVSDEDLAMLYNAASLLVFPSLEEGFGLPAIEAMSCGTPVAASNTGSLPEVISGAGKFFDPRDPDDIARVAYEVLSSETLRSEMREAGLRRSRDFEWEKAARDAAKIFEEAVYG
ncbi:MAG: glycosyltransferase family 1 protein [Acidobacteria bacterium]|nr:MAG: glycosyltransferase family 1 protein [Acidobacteriota bacterium]REK01187.1 MAG: glycosyltransferase family 1 protein [Acidobacteriota bacterium]REK14143.1 MAG: glycosyltransferase family 1 protein [Acidobacteriota bacterium]REK44858.1 MAG: glycosyltransferase family 1 protein [Acidobacteriota bacterium]